MREIKFRAWHIESKKMIYQDPSTLGAFFDHEAYPESDFLYEQYIGLDDESGREIYEGDIIQLSCGCCVYEIFWQQEFLRYWLKDDGLSQIHGKHINVFEHQVAVIGNIHENPELI